MKMLLRLLLTMTCSGSLSLLCYYLFVWCFGQKLNYFWRYLYLKLCLMLYLLPLPLLKLVIVPQNPLLNPQLNIGDYANLGNTIHIMNNGVVEYTSDFEKCFLFICIIIFITIILYYLFRYIRMRRLVDLCVSSTDPYHDIFNEQKPKLRIKRNIKVKYVDTAISSFTYGIITPTVVVSSCSKESTIPSVIQHELYHIKHNDFFFRGLAHLSLLIHCFNPFVYLFLKEIKETQELYCDASLADNLSASEKKHYGYMLLELHQLLYQKKIMKMHLPLVNRNNSLLKKRITNLTAPKSQKNLLSSILLAISLAVSAIPAAAYNPPEIFDWRETDMMTEELEDIDWLYIDEANALFSADEANFQYTDTYVLP